MATRPANQPADSSRPFNVHHLIRINKSLLRTTSVLWCANSNITRSNHYFHMNNLIAHTAWIFYFSVSTVKFRRWRNRRGRWDWCFAATFLRCGIARYAIDIKYVRTKSDNSHSEWDKFSKSIDQSSENWRAHNIMKSLKRFNRWEYLHRLTFLALCCSKLLDINCEIH